MNDQVQEMLFNQLKCACDNLTSSIQNRAPKNILIEQLDEAYETLKKKVEHVRTAIMYDGE